jgi:hypothetical protein
LTQTNLIYISWFVPRNNFQAFHKKCVEKFYLSIFQAIKIGPVCFRIRALPIDQVFWAWALFGREKNIALFKILNIENKKGHPEHSCHLFVDRLSFLITSPFDTRLDLESKSAWKPTQFLIYSYKIVKVLKFTAGKWFN